MTETLAPSPVFSASPGPGAQGAFGFARSLVSVVSPMGPQADAIRALRTHVVAQHMNFGRRALAVCAPNAGVGCTFIAANLAVSLAQIGAKTLLMDADLRSPSIDRLIRPSNPVGGLSRCLTRMDEAFTSNISTGVLPNLSIMYAGHAAPNAQELLASEQFGTLMSFCFREFDITIIDTPAANTSSDVRRICSVTGYSLIVVGQDQTFVRDYQILNTQLKADGATVIGTVLNRA